MKLKIVNKKEFIETNVPINSFLLTNTSISRLLKTLTHTGYGNVV
jgi:hypothetical protein